MTTQSNRFVRGVMRLVCWTLFWLGHATSRALVPIWPGLFYPLYNNLMHWSVNVNDKYGFDVWSDPCDH